MEESSAPLSSADKPGQQLCETQQGYWLEPFRSFSACECVGEKGEEEVGEEREEEPGMFTTRQCGLVMTAESTDAYFWFWSSH